MAKVWRQLTDLRRRSDGGVIVATGLMLPIVLGFAALAVDIGLWRATKLDMQTAVDAAALAAAFELSKSGSTTAAAISAAKDDAALNGFAAVGDTQVNVAVAGDGQSVTVTITQPKPVFLASLMMGNTVNVGVAAAASVGGGVPTCILALAPSGRGIDMDSNAEINANGCSIHVNSTSSSAIRAQSSSEINVTDSSFCVAGDYSGGSSHYSPTPDTGCAPLSDPLASMPEPSVGSCDYNNFNQSDRTAPMNPGVYCGGLKLDGNSNVTFNSGTYIISGGEFELNSNTVVQGSEVFFFLTNGARIYFDSDVQVSFTAPTTGTYAGMLFFGDRSDSVTHRFDSNNTNVLEGTVYFPTSTVSMDSNSTMAGASAFSIFIAYRFSLDSNSGIGANSDFASSSVPLPSGLGGGQTTLIQ